MGAKLRCNGFWLFSRWLRRQMQKQGAVFPDGWHSFHSIASHYWNQVHRPVFPVGFDALWSRKADD